MFLIWIFLKIGSENRSKILISCFLFVYNSKFLISNVGYFYVEGGVVLQGPGRWDVGAFLFVVLTAGFLFIRGTATTLFLMLLLFEGTCFPIPPFLISLQHLSTVSYANFLKCLQNASFDFLIQYFLIGGPDCSQVYQSIYWQRDTGPNSEVSYFRQQCVYSTLKSVQLLRNFLRFSPEISSWLYCGALSYDRRGQVPVLYSTAVICQVLLYTQLSVP